MSEIDYPVERSRRQSRDTRLVTHPGESVMLCPISRRMEVFAFAPDDRLICKSCGFSITREEATT